MNRHPRRSAIAALGLLAVTATLAGCVSTSRVSRPVTSPVTSSTSASTTATASPSGVRTTTPTTSPAPTRHLPTQPLTVSPKRTTSPSSRPVTATTPHATTSPAVTHPANAVRHTAHSYPTTARRLCERVIGSRPGYSAPGWTVSCVPEGSAHLDGADGNADPNTSRIWVGFHARSDYTGLLYVTAHELSHAYWWTQLSDGNRAWWAEQVSGTTNLWAGSYDNQPIERYADTRAKCLGYLLSGHTEYKPVRNGCALVAETNTHTWSSSYRSGIQIATSADSLNQIEKTWLANLRKVAAEGCTVDFRRGHESWSVCPAGTTYEPKTPQALVDAGRATY